MALFKRIFFFGLVNILILVMASISWTFIAPLLGIDPNAYYSQLLFFSLVFGMGGAFVSLMLSKFMAKNMMGVQIIDPNTAPAPYRQVVQKVYDLAGKAGLPKMPEVGIYDSPDVNAFATGPSKSNSLVAVSTGLMQRMNDNEVEGVLAHEVAHIANGDMVTMTLIQGVMNAIVLFASRILANLVASQMDRDQGPWVHLGIVIAFQIVLGVLASIVVNWFSRWREFRADAGGARLAGKDKMIAALQSLQRQVEQAAHPEQEAIAAFKISGRKKKGLMARLFSTHPPLDERIERLHRAGAL